MEAANEEHASILAAALADRMEGHFDVADNSKIGKDNLYGDDWQVAHVADDVDDDASLDSDDEAD